MSVMDRFLNIMKLNDGEDDDAYYDDDDYLDEEDSKDDKVLPMKPEIAEEPKKTASRIAPVRQQPRKLNTSGMEVCVIKPTSVEDAREITETLLANRSRTD